MSDSKLYKDGDKLIKIYLSDTYEYVERAYQRQKFVYDAGLSVPAVINIKKINDKETALEMEYIDGKPLVYMYKDKGEEALIKAMRVMVKLQCQMNAIDASGLPDLTDFYSHEITMTPYLTPELKKATIAYMKNLDKGKTNLCHGDIHSYNIMYNGDKYWIIDWEDASKGDPAADACMSYFYFMRWAAKDNNKSDEQYLQLFCEESGIAQEDILAWLPVIACVQVNIDDVEDREFISNFINQWHKEHDNNPGGPP